MNAPEMWVCYVKRNLPEVMHAARVLRQRNVNHARWNVILIVALEDKQERREGCFAADLAVNVFSTTISGLVSC